jgi:hypothetical protein
MRLTTAFQAPIVTWWTGERVPALWSADPPHRQGQLELLGGLYIALRDD